MLPSNTKRSSAKPPTSLLKVPSSRIYGVEKLTIQGSEVFVSDRERTLVDLIYFPAPVGGSKKAFEILQSQSKKRLLRRLRRCAVVQGDHAKQIVNQHVPQHDRVLHFLQPSDHELVESAVSAFRIGPFTLGTLLVFLPPRLWRPSVDATRQLPGYHRVAGHTDPSLLLVFSRPP